MKKYKRIMSIVVAFILILSSGTIFAFGESNNWIDSPPYYFCKYGVMEGSMYQEYQSVQSWNDDGDGMVTASVSWLDPDTGEEHNESIKYYNFDSSFIDAPDKWAYEDFVSCYNAEDLTLNVDLILTKPSYAEGNDVDGGYHLSNINGIPVKTKVEYFDPTVSDDQMIKIYSFLSLTPDNVALLPVTKGSLPYKEIIVRAKVVPADSGSTGVIPSGDESAVTPNDEAKPVTEAIAALSSDGPDPAAVAAARDAYNKLSDEAKKSVPAETLKKLETAEANVTESLIEALDEDNPDPGAVAAARSAYEKLSDGAKAVFSSETLNKLEAAEAAVIANEQKAVGAETIISAGTVMVTSTENKTVAFTAASNSKKSIVIPASVEIAGETFKVTEISAGAFKGTAATSVTIGKNVKKISNKAFAGSKVTKLIVKSKNLTKKSVKNSLKGSKVKTVQVKVGTKKQSTAYVKKYKKYFTKANAGRKVTVK